MDAFVGNMSSGCCAQKGASTFLDMHHLCLCVKRRRNTFNVKEEIMELHFSKRRKGKVEGGERDLYSGGSSALLWWPGEPVGL